MDDDQLKNGCSMILDPFGDVIAECRELNNQVVTALLTPEKLTLAGGYRYLKARRPDLYNKIISKAHESKQQVVWLNEAK
jgi:predicted amidohydrolase